MEKRDETKVSRAVVWGGRARGHPVIAEIAGPRSSANGHEMAVAIVSAPEGPWGPRLLAL